MPDLDKTPDPNAPWSPEEADIEHGLTAEQVEYIKSQIPVVQEVIEWFDTQIAEFLNPNVIETVTEKSDPKQVKDAVRFAQKMSRGYSKKRNEFADKFKKYLEPPEGGVSQE